jgi:hypothetical protein
VCLAFFFVLTGAGLASLTSFRSRPQQPTEPGTAVTNGNRQITESR